MSAEIRPAVPEDLPEILRLMRNGLGWPQDERAEELWRWKHEQSPFGASSVWVAADGQQLVALRTFLRWRLRTQDGAVVDAVRAVDTTTDHGHRGQGWFRRLTLRALEALSTEGVSFVFNTPNEQSRAGNLSMGWTDQPRPLVWFRPGRVSSVPLLLRSRTSADLWPVPCDAGRSAAEVFGDAAAFAPRDHQPLASRPALQTDRSPEFYKWRYGLDTLGYRVVAAPGGLPEGFAVFRARRRGASTERAVLEVVGDRRAVTGALRQPPRYDHALSIGRCPGPGWFPVPGLGPRLVTRSLAGEAPKRLALTLGDIELF